MERIPITRVVSIAAAISFTLIAAVIFSRRLFGDHLVNLAPGESVFYAACFAVLAVSLARHLIQTATNNFLTSLVPIASALAVILFVASLSAAPITLFISLLAASGMAFLTCLASIRQTFQHVDRKSLQQIATTPESPIDRRQTEEFPVAHEELSELSPQFDAQTTRRCANGLTTIEGYLSFSLSASEIIKILHFPIWPPLSAPPAIQPTLDGFSGRIRVTLSKTYGFRIEVRRTDQCDEPVEGVLHFIAKSSEVRAAA